MGVANVSSAWVSGNLVFYDASGAIIVTYDGTNRKLTIPSGSTLESLGTTTIADASLSVNDLALAEGSILVGDSAGKATALSAKTTTRVLVGNGTTITSVALSSDATMVNTGAVTISNDAITTAKILNAAVTSAKLANGAGVAALLTAGLGGSASVLKTDTLTHTIVAANGSKARACIVMVVVDETYAVGTGTLPGLVIGEADTTNKFMTAGTLDTEAAGTVLFFAGTNTATKAITATSTAALGNSTGGCSITVLAIPTT
jgi:hypothetical protein